MFSVQKIHTNKEIAKKFNKNHKIWSNMINTLNAVLKPYKIPSHEYLNNVSVKNKTNENVFLFVHHF